MIYRISLRFGAMDCTANPPRWITEVFPTFDGWPVTLSESECIVTAPEGVEPVANPLLKIEIL